MKKIIENLVVRYGKQLCSIAMVAAVASVNSCRGLFYQPEEPEGLLELAKKREHRCTK